MAKNGKIIDRRDFLYKGFSFLFGSLFGFSSFSKALAIEGHRNNSFFQPFIALIIDDIGLSFSRARQFLELGAPITFSILPRISHSYDLALEIHDKGHEIMLHQPMEPLNPRLNPGPGALYVGYDAQRIVGIMEENFSSVPFAVGVNNHMGSRFTEQRREVNDALSIVKKKGLFFIDSLTSKHSIAHETAKRLHMVTDFRNVFLDNQHNESAILCQLNRLQNHALKYGHAIGIGHPYPQTAKAIGKFLRSPEYSGISLVHISSIVRA
jgi:hypothetical protein